MRPVLADAAEVARRALVALEPDGVGVHLGVTAEDETAATHRFEATLAGYRGWQWAVVVAAPPGAESATVSESALLPGPDALIAPDFVPWEQRVRPGDLGPGDLLAPPADDPRLVPGYVATGDPVVDEVAREVGLGRVQVLSLEGRIDAAQRWYTEFGPDTEMAKAAPSTCGLCGFYVPLAGALRESFGVCANAMGADGHVVHIEYGCGAHSDVVAPSGNGSPRYEAFDDHAVDYVDIPRTTELPGDNPQSAEASAAAEHAGDNQETAEAEAVEAAAAEATARAEGTTPESAAEVIAAESETAAPEAKSTPPITDANASTEPVTAEAVDTAPAAVNDPATEGTDAETRAADEAAADNAGSAHDVVTETAAVDTAVGDETVAGTAPVDTAVADDAVAGTAPVDTAVADEVNTGSVAVDEQSARVESAGDNAATVAEQAAAGTAPVDVVADEQGVAAESAGGSADADQAAGAGTAVDAGVEGAAADATDVDVAAEAGQEAAEPGSGDAAGGSADIVAGHGSPVAR